MKRRRENNLRLPLALVVETALGSVLQLPEASHSGLEEEN
jgi:hypothetical protein